MTPAAQAQAAGALPLMGGGVGATEVGAAAVRLLSVPRAVLRLRTREEALV